MKKENTLYQALLASATSYPKRPALIYMGRAINYRVLLKRVHLLAQGLISHGIKKNDVVSVCLPNIPSVVDLLYAINQIGAIANLIHPLMKYEQMKDIMMETGSHLLFALDTAYADFAPLKDIGIRLIACSPVRDVNPIIKIGYYLQNRRLLQKVIKSDDLEAFYGHNEYLAYDADDRKDAFYLHSGGTTGKPKVIALSSFAVNALASNGLEILGINDTANKYMLAVLPLFHGFGLCMGMHACLAFGACNTLMPKFHSNQVVSYLRKGHISFIIGVPILFEALLRNKNFRGRMLQNLHVAFVGGDFVAPSLIDRFNAHMIRYGSKARLYEGYGLTEVVTVCSVNTEAHHRKGSVGRLLPNVEMKIVDVASKLDLPIGKDGEIYVKGETMMNGYRFLKDEAEQPFVKDDKGQTWIATGDYGNIDNERFVYFRQRLKRIIKVAGVNVFPNEIEGAVMELGHIHECAAIAIADAKLGNAIKLFIVLNRTSPVTNLDCEVRQIVEKRCGIYAVPRQIVYCLELPKTLVGKVDTKALS